MKRVVISGGGIAGLTLAYWLHQRNMSVLVVERAPKLRDDGYAIDFLGMGFDVAERMGILPALKAKQVPVRALTYVDSAGRTIASLTIDRIRKVLGGRYLALMHQTLEQVLFEAVEQDAEIQFGKSIAAVEAADERVMVTLDDGSRHACDLLVGAGGIHSNVRALVMGPESHFLRPMGYVLACYRVPDHYDLGPNWTTYLEPNRMVALYAGDTPGSAFAFFMYKTNDHAYIARSERAAVLRKEFNGVGWITHDLLADADAADDIFMDTVAQIVMPKWHSGRVVLVGDACDCPTLVSGQGASLAMGGAYVLAQCLQDTADFGAAFGLYERTVRPYADSQQKAARGFVKSFIPSTRFGVALQRLLLPVLFLPAFTGLLRRQFDVRSVIEAAAS